MPTATTNRPIQERIPTMAVVLRIQVHRLILNILNIKWILNIPTGQRIRWVWTTIILNMLAMVLLKQAQVSTRIPMVRVSLSPIHAPPILCLSLAYGVGYEYNSYMAPMGSGGINGSVAHNGAGGQAENSSPSEKNNYEHENHYGIGKASLVTSPNYQKYPIA